MSDISKIKLGDTEYDVKDAVARAQGGGVIGTVEADQTITIRGSSVFGFFIINDEFFSISINSSGVLFAQQPGSVEIREQGDDELVLWIGDLTNYIIFGATDITVED